MSKLSISTGNSMVNIDFCVRGIKQITHSAMPKKEHIYNYTTDSMYSILIHSDSQKTKMSDTTMRFNELTG